MMCHLLVEALQNIIWDGKAIIMRVIYFIASNEIVRKL